MKRLLFASAAIAACMFVSCNTKTESTASTTDNSAKYKELNARVYHTIETGDTAGIREWIAADAVDHGGAPDGGDVKGDSIINMLAMVHTGFQPGMKYTVESQAVDGDNLFVLAHLTGTTSATPMWGMPPNQKIDSRDISLIKIKDGKASDHWEYMSNEDVMKMMKMGHEGMAVPPADKMHDDKMMHTDTAKKM